MLEAGDGNPRRIDHLILETYDPNGADPFAERAWMRTSTHAGVTSPVFYDKNTVLEPGKAAAGDVIEWKSSLVAPESGRYTFAARTVGGARAEIIVGGETDAMPVLEKGKSYPVVFRVTVSSSDDSCEFGWTLPSAQRPGEEVLRKTCEQADAVLVFTGTTMGCGQAQETGIART